jgi:hypothetical protein
VQLLLRAAVTLTVIAQIGARSLIVGAEALDAVGDVLIGPADILLNLDGATIIGWGIAAAVIATVIVVTAAIAVTDSGSSQA